MSTRTNYALTDFSAGERVEYLLPRSPVHGRQTDWWLPATVVRISASRVIVRLDKWPQGRTRATTPTQVRKVGAA